MSFPNILQRMTERFYKTTNVKNVNEKEKKWEKYQEQEREREGGGVKNVLITDYDLISNRGRILLSRNSMMNMI